MQKTKLMALFLTLVLLLGLLPANALAADTAGDAADGTAPSGEPEPYSGEDPDEGVDPVAADPVEILMSVSLGGTFAETTDGGLMREQTVTVSDKNGDGKLTLDEAMVAAHEQYCTGGAGGFATAEDENGCLQMSMLWGQSEKVGRIWANHEGTWEEYPSHKLISITDTEVKEGDFIYAFTNTLDEGTDLYSEFNLPMGHELYVGIPYTITVKPYSSTNTTVGFSYAYTLTIEGEEDGYELGNPTGTSFTVTFKQAGTYTLLAAAENATSYGKTYAFTPASNTIEVKEAPDNILTSLAFSSDSAGEQALPMTPEYASGTHEYTISLYDSTSSCYFKGAGSDGYQFYYPVRTPWGATQWQTGAFGTALTLSAAASQQTIQIVPKGDTWAVGYVTVSFQRVPTLKSLSVNETMAPAFDGKATKAYEAYVDASKPVVISAEAANPNYTVTINGQALTDGSCELSGLDWSSGSNEVEIQVSYPKDSSYQENTYTLTLKKMEQGETPKVYIQPKGGSYYVTDTPDALSFTATSGGTMTYQWYRNQENSTTGGTALSGANEISYTPDISEPGDWYYYCTITNTATSKSASTEPVLVSSKADPTPMVTLVTKGDAIPGKEGYTHPVETGYVYDAGAEAVTPLKVEAATAGEESKLTYQWQYAKAASPGTFSKISRATAAEYAPSAASPTKSNGYVYYRCEVTYTDEDGRTFTAASDPVYVYVYTTEEQKASDQIIRTQPSLSKDEYETTEQASFSMQLYSGSLIDQITYQWYRNTENSYDGAEALTNEKASGTTTSAVPIYRPEIAVGTYYYFCELTNTLQNTSATQRTNILKLTYKDPSQSAAAEKFEGSGTEADPFQLEDEADLAALAELVNDGNHMYGLFFQMTGDVTLPDDWAGIGTTENGFRGIFDGGGHQVTVPEGKSALFNDVEDGARIQNLKIYGTRIEGHGLVTKAIADGVVYVDRVTLCAGTNTTGCGLLTTSISSMDRVQITNCTAEAGVVVGCDGTRSDIGTFTGNLNGTVMGCVSYATVKGVDYVGGIAGKKPSSMGEFNVVNCAFYGTIEATGSNVGGIVGGGYDNRTAPNTPCVSVENCVSGGTITGKDNVGGIFGAESGVVQCWSNGIGYIRNNVFTGTVTATDGAAGAIVGYIRGMNRYNVIENNYYLEGSADKGIGKVFGVDTTGVSEGWRDGVYYFQTDSVTVQELAVIDHVFDERYGAGGTDNPGGYALVGLVKHNRTDDPLGADADKLAKAMSAEEMKDGTVVALLNASSSSYKNWIQGDEAPELSTEPVAVKLEISGDYQTEFYIGDALDLDGMVITVTMSDSSTKTLNWKSEGVEITGYDNSERATLVLTLSYGAAKTTFDVKVLKRPESGSSNITVSFTLLGDEEHGDPTEETGTHTLKDGNLTTWLTEESYTVDYNATVWDLMETVEKRHSNVSFSNPSGNYVDYVTYNGNTIGEFDNGRNSGWMYTLNGTHPLLGVSEQFLENGDKIVFHYSDDYTVEEGSEPWWDENHGGSKDSADQKAADAVKDLIAAIGTVTEESGDKIEAARAAYDKLTAAQKKLVTNYDVLTKAEAAYAELTIGVPFADVKGHWALEAIRYVYEHGLMNGVGSSRFQPNGTLNRAMVATILYRMEGEPAVAGGSAFSDVPSGEWFSDAVAWASANGIVNGMGGGKFAPMAEITREQLAAMLYRYAEYKNYDTTAAGMSLKEYADYGAVSAWALEALEWANAAGLITGRTATEIVPGGTATRAEAAVILMRFSENVAP